MKRTKKYVAAVHYYNQITKTRLKKQLENAALYDWLEARGHWWDAANGEWTNAKKPSNSIFKSDDDMPSGVIRLRVMAHPDDVESAVLLCKKTPGMRVIEVSDPYQNRRGAGVRVYLTAVLD